MNTAAVEFVDYEKEHGRYIAEHMRYSDRKEMYYLAAIKPMAAIEMSVAFAADLKVATVNGIPALIFGVGYQTMFSDVAVPWLLGTDVADTYQYRFGRYSRKIFDDMYKPFDRMENYVLAENKKTIRWIKWLGFDMMQPSKYGIFGADFIRFGKGLG